jgi:hypothetical protein
MSIGQRQRRIRGSFSNMQDRSSENNPNSHEKYDSTLVEQMNELNNTQIKLFESVK